MEKKRDNYWDIWKGLAIIVVVFIHASGLNKFEYPHLNSIIGVMLRQFTNFAVPLFFALSGYFAAKSPLATRADLTTFYNKKLTRIIWPYVIWSLVATVLFFPERFSNLPSLAFRIASGRTSSTYYFIIVLLQLTCITPILARIKQQRTHLFWMFLMPVIALSMYYYFRIYMPESLFGKFPFNALPFPVWIVFYHLGFYASKYREQSRLFRYQNAVLYIAFYLIFLFLSQVEGILWASNGMLSLGRTQIKATCFIASFFMIMWMFLLHSPRIAKLNKFAILGRNSFFIYLIHTFFIRIFDEQLLTIIPVAELQLLVFVLNTILTLIACQALGWGLKKLTPESFYRKYLGL